MCIEFYNESIRRIMMNRKPRVISIASVSGGGKTTTVKQLSEKLNNAKALYFDDYDFEECPHDICEWVDHGADYNQWNLTPLIKDIQFLLNIQNQPLNYILLDYPFAYLNSGMRDYIDCTIFIDTPLDIAMARRILRDFTDCPIENVRNDLAHYLSRARSAYLEMIRTVKPNSDVVIDGSLHSSLIVEQVLRHID